MASHAKLVGGLATACLLLTGCAQLGLSSRFTAREEVRKAFNVDRPPQISVVTFNGPVDIMTGGSDKVEIKVVKRAGGQTQEDAEDDLDNIEVFCEQSGNKIRVEARSINSKSFADRGAGVEILVPEASILDLTTTNGKVSVVGMVGKTEARTSNGAIEAKGSRGELILRTSNGSVAVEGGTGRISAQTSNGSIEIASTKSAIDAQTSNGRVSFSGALPEGKHTLRTSNGSIQLKLPDFAAFELNATTSNGRITSDFAKNGPPESKSKKHNRSARLSGVFGGEAPSASLELSSSNGNIEIKRQ
jgi:DUF4097 and DUF4098 domain-containing protein YvlB